MRIRPGIIFLLLWGIFLAAADVLYLKYLQPARLGKTMAGILHDATGLTPVIARLSFSLVPRAGVEIHGLTLQPETGHDITISAEYCRAELSWLSLLRLKPVLRRVELRSPVLTSTGKKRRRTAIPAAFPILLRPRAHYPTSGREQETGQEETSLFPGRLNYPA